MGFFDRLKQGLQKTREGISQKVEQILVSFVKIDDALFDELEEALIMSDIGTETSLSIIENIKRQTKERRLTDPAGIRALLRAEIESILSSESGELNLAAKPSVILVLGVNGVGKTTSIGKLAHYLNQSGKRVLIAAADTFRAAAIDQLEIWVKRAGADLIRHDEGSDPAAVVFDAVHAAKSRGADVLICDTAGRLHTKKNLMEELKKLVRVIDRELPGSLTETLLVLDATTGQNAVRQAAQFKEAAAITGIVLTKLDGTAKGGVVISIKSELGIPVKLVGVGEGIEDLQPFDPKEFAGALFGSNTEVVA
ncbi:MAG: signal recognition particle-docking protein FtsY [Clostridiales bacterium]|jgi:fused signal recognition particle receptor|nr:signal recognition particle-docking protein FtsY [Clostridiales bacterium]